MSKTKRELVWSYTLTMTYRQGDAVTSWEISENLDVSEKTAREALHNMEDDGFVKRKNVEGRVRYQSIPDGF